VSGEAWKLMEGFVWVVETSQQLSQALEVRLYAQ
jgi:hypothetical protein